MNIIDTVRKELNSNGNKLSFEFLKKEVSKGSVIYLKPTDNMRICIIQLPYGHEVLGVAQVLDSNNDVEQLGNEVAYNNAINELWKVFGNIAKGIM